MRIKEGFVLRQVADSYVVMNLGSEISFNGMLTLNESGALLWNAILEGADADGLVTALLNEYDVSEEIAKKDVAAFIEKIKGAGILE